MKLHKVAQLFPQMPDNEFENLVADIREHGVRQPILVTDGQIIDGRHRWKVCEKLEIECPTVEWDGEGSLLDVVISLNLKRRHLTQSQAAAIAVEALPLYEAEAKERQLATLKRGAKQPERAEMPEREVGRARDHAARAMNVSPRSVQYAKEVRAHSPEQFEAIKRGETTVYKAQSVLKREPKPKKNDNGKADWTRLAELAADGNTSHQIAKKLGVGRDWVARKATQLGVTIQADRVMGKSHSPKPRLIFKEFVDSIEALAPSCDMIDLDALTPEIFHESVPVITDAMKTLRKFERRVKEKINDKQEPIEK